MTYNSLEVNSRRAEQDRISEQRRYEWQQLELRARYDVGEFNAIQLKILDQFAVEHGWTRQHMYRFAKRVFSSEFCVYYRRYSTAVEDPRMEYI